MRFLKLNLLVYINTPEKQSPEYFSFQRIEISMLPFPHEWKSIATKNGADFHRHAISILVFDFQMPMGVFSVSIVNDLFSIL